MENQTENTNVTYENQQQFEPLHKSFCRECGTMISEKADICPNCGATQHRAKVPHDTQSDTRTETNQSPFAVFFS